MKKILSIVAGLTAYAIVSAAPNIFVIDMAKVYNSYYKAKTAFAQINSSAESAKQELQKMDAERNKIAKQLDPIKEKMNNPALSEDAKRKIYAAEAQPILMQIGKIENQMKELQQQTSERLQKNVNSVRQVHIEEILEVLKQVSAEKKADFVLEKNACPFYKPTADITEDLIKAINANAPAAQK